MQRMSYIYFLYFTKQQSMQNQNYRSVPTSQEFQPIQVELETTKQSKDVDFKLFVLLILIVFLGILINKYEEQLQLQTENAIQLNKAEYIAQLLAEKQSASLEKVTIQNVEENQKSLSSKKQLYSPDKTFQNSKNQQQPKEIKIEQINQPQQQKQLNQITEHLSETNTSSSSQKSQKNLRSAKQTSETNEKTKVKNHRNLLKKYVEFYFWFPFFIFALIVYTCYENQYTQSSIFISVKKINEMESMDLVQQCAICITEMKSNDLLAALPCSSKHVFHSECIKQWFELKKTCPICRCDVREFKRRSK